MDMKCTGYDDCGRKGLLCKSPVKKNKNKNFLKPKNYLCTVTPIFYTDFLYKIFKMV